MAQTEFKYIYGPVYSWRLGMSLGIDPLSTKSKICNFDCIYCQLGRTVKFENTRQEFISVEEIMSEIKTFPAEDIDYYTFSGRGEPTLASNLGAMIKAIKKETQGKVAIITDSALIDKEEVQADLLLADVVLAKLDGCDQESLSIVDIPAPGIQFDNIVKGLKAFKKKFMGKLALQIMFIKDNQHCAKAIADIARDIGADEIQLNTPLRPSAVLPLSEEEMLAIKQHFQGLPATTVFENERKNIQPLNDKATIRRHGNFKKTG